LANSPRAVGQQFDLPSAPLAFFHSFMTKTSLTDGDRDGVDALGLDLVGVGDEARQWFLWQVGVNAPGTANSTTFLPLKTSSVVFGFGAFGRHHSELCFRQTVADLDGHGCFLSLVEVEIGAVT
jgi:hypothetical protein